MNRASGVLCAWLLCVSAAGVARAQDADPKDQPSKAEIQRLKGILQSEHPLNGDVPIPAADATLHLGDNYYFLGADDARQVLKEWGNPPDAADGVLGIVFPKGKSFLDETWGAVVTYEPSGYIADKDANANYDKYLDAIRKDEDQAKRRGSEGWL